MADSGPSYTGVSSHSAFASNDPTFDSYDALRDCVTKRARSVERPRTAYPRRRSSDFRSASPPMLPTPLSEEKHEANMHHADEMEVIDVQNLESDPDDEVDEVDVPPQSVSHSHQSSSREENPQFVDRTESPPLQDLPFHDRHPVVELSREIRVTTTVSGPGVGNFGVAIKGEVASFNVACHLPNGDPWEWEPTSTAESLPVLVEVDDVSEEPSNFVEPVWIQYSGKGVFKASYKVPEHATRLDVKVFLHGDQVGATKYTVHPTIALPVEVARVIGSGVPAVDALFSPTAQKATKLRQPRDVAISSDNAFLCVTDVDNQQVLVYSGIDNRLLRRLGDSIHTDDDLSDREKKPVAGRLHHPWGVAISQDCEHVAVTDSFHHCIQIFNVADGSVFKIIGDGRGANLGSLNRPAGLKFDKRGNLFVCDSSNHRIQMFSERGKPLRSFGDGEGPLEGQLRYPLGVDLSPDNSKLYVCDSKNHRISVFDVLTGECVRTFGQPHLSQPISISLSSDESSVFVRDNDCDRVIVFSPDGKRLCVLGQVDENSPDNFPGRLAQGAGMTVTPLGHLYAVDKASATVVVLRAPVQVDDGASTHSRGSIGAQSIITTVSGLLGRDPVLASLSVSSRSRSRHQPERRSDSVSSAVTVNPSPQHRFSLPDSTVLSIHASESPPVQRREQYNSRGRSSDLREFAARLDSEWDDDEAPKRIHQTVPSRRKHYTQPSPSPKYEVFEKLSDDDDYRRNERPKASERVSSRKHRSKSPDERLPASSGSSRTSKSANSKDSINTIEIEKRVFKAVEEGVSGLVETATESVRVEFEAAIQQMELRIMESMKRLVSQAVRGAVETVLAAQVKPPLQVVQPQRMPAPVYHNDRLHLQPQPQPSRGSRPLARHISSNSRDVSSSRSPSPQVMKSHRSIGKLARHRQRSSSKTRRKQAHRHHQSARDDLDSGSER